MGSIEQFGAGGAATPRLEGRLARLWAEHRQVVEQLATLQSSNAWMVVRRLSQLRRRLLPDGSRRQGCFRLCLRGLRLWRREGIVALLGRTAHKLIRPGGARKEEAKEIAFDSFAPQLPSFVETASSDRALRVAFIGSREACEAQSMRYRAHNVIEALTLVGIEARFFALEEVQAQLKVILAHDLIVLVRMMYNPITALVIDAARRLGLPTVFDIDDYLFDPWVFPYIEAFRGLPSHNGLRILDEFAACLQACDYFTGSNTYLLNKAATLGKKGFVIPNGLNGEQLRVSHALLKQRSNRRENDFTRIGYLSGTRTHQGDFRLVYPALMAVLREQPDVRLVIVGALDVEEFPGLAPFLDQIDLLPLRPWTELPAAIANIDINLICLEQTPFNEGKSNLKYFEAALLRVPSIASPTRIHCENIRHGHNGLLAGSTEEWYAGLKELVSSVERREQMGEHALEQVLNRYVPLATAVAAMEAYQQILEWHRGPGVEGGSARAALVSDLGERIRIAKQVLDDYKQLPHITIVEAHSDAPFTGAFPRTGRLHRGAGAVNAADYTAKKTVSASGVA